jgi:cytoskeletal protein CcmA (bactofilin family)
MAIARGGRINFALILMEVARWARRSLVAHVRSKFAVLTDQAGRLVLGRIRRGESKMADQEDDLGIPMKPARSIQASTVPPRAPDLPRTNTDAAPVSATPPPPIPLVLRPSPQTVQTPAPPRPRTNQEVHLSDNSVEARKLIVGPGITLTGEINSCDRLIVEGSVQANLQSCQNMIIAETGLFNGNAAIHDAEIYGRFEGDLVVHNLLLIRASGQVSGTITYGQVEIEVGGKISGSLQAS